MSLREDVDTICELLGIEAVTLPQAIEAANKMMGIVGEGTLPAQAQVLLEACNSTTETVKAELDDDEVPSAGRDFSQRGDTCCPLPTARMWPRSSWARAPRASASRRRGRRAVQSPTHAS
jgi:hypothetical protein